LERGCVRSTSRSTLKGSVASGIFQQAGFAKLLRLVLLGGTQPRSGGSARMRPLLAWIQIRLEPARFSQHTGRVKKKISVETI
jgi:hypothetical protein